MIERTRSFFATVDTSVGVTVGVVGGLMLYYTFVAFGYGFIVPILRESFLSNSDSAKPFEFTIGGVTFDYQQLLVDFTALLLTTAVGYVIFVWKRAPLDSSPAETRDCPECKSEIWIGARRCAYCTSPVEPMVEQT